MVFWEFDSRIPHIFQVINNQMQIFGNFFKIFIIAPFSLASSQLALKLWSTRFVVLKSIDFPFYGKECQETGFEPATNSELSRMLYHWAYSWQAESGNWTFSFCWERPKDPSTQISPYSASTVKCGLSERRISGLEAITTLNIVFSCELGIRTKYTQKESNLHTGLRRPLLYPLSYGCI